ncbi:MAG TPA: hypothetical protein VJU61_24850 [Polyangiaceae bacterium]|nr:hypothetical protein [Polyangiaceae bacterium]
MNRTRIAVLVFALAGGAALALWWLLRPTAKPARVPPATPPVPAEVPSDSAESISRLRREIEQLRQGGKSRVVYRAGSGEELERHRGWVDAMLRWATRGAGAEVPAPAGFQLLQLDNAVSLLVEQQDQRRGAGVVVLRQGTAQPWVIEVPHSFFDEGTLEIGLNAFAWSQARALLVNTVHRYRSLNGEAPDGSEADEDGAAVSDVAHAEASFFLTAHAACVDGLGKVGVVQLHGFSDASAPSADLVLSAAGSNADPLPVERALERALDIRVAVYPTEIKKLGGTKNQQGRYSITAARPFLHVEMSRSLRKRLNNDPDQLRRFVAALLGGGG